MSAASRPWAPPEQYNIKDTSAISFASDIYSLGQTFYAFLTGVIPPDFSEVTSGSAILQYPSELNKDVTDYLDEVVVKCIQTKRDKRYQTIEEFLFALQGEKDYKIILAKTREAEQKEDYKQAIHLLNESEKYIPLSSDLLERRYDYQHKLKQQQKEGENKQKEKEALRLMLDGDFEKALSIWELLPLNAHISQQMEKCRQGISLRKKTELIAETENLIRKKQYENALSKYQEAKVIDQSDVAIDRSIEELQKILQDIEKNKKYNEFIAIGDKAFENNELEKALEAYKLAKDNVTLSPFTIDKKIETCVIALSERDEREKAKDATKKALAKVKDKPLLKIAEQELASEIEHNNDKLKLIEDFRVKYASSDTFQAELLSVQARAKELEQLRLYFEAKTENYKRAYDVALKILADVTSPTLKESVISLQKEIKNAQETIILQQAEDAIKKKNYQAATRLLNDIPNSSTNYGQATQLFSTIDKEKFDNAKSLFDRQDWQNALNAFNKIKRKSAYYNEAQSYIRTLKQRIETQHHQKLISDARQKVEEKRYKNARQLLAQIPAQSSVDEAKQELLQKIANAEKGKRNKTGLGIIIFIVVIIISLVIGRLSKREIQPTPPAPINVDSLERVQREIEKLKADSIATENARIEEERNREEAERKAAQEARLRKEKEEKAAREQERQATENKRRALAIVEEGNKLFSRGEYDAACEKYIQANRLSYGTGNVGASKFDELVQKLSFDKEAPGYKNSVARANRIRNAK